MGRGAPGLFKRLMPLADVKGAAVTQEERDRMAGGRAGVFVLFCFFSDICTHVIQRRGADGGVGAEVVLFVPGFVFADDEG